MMTDTPDNGPSTTVVWCFATTREAQQILEQERVNNGSNG